ncbi:hypothetical protein [uncultured Planococcus sp.]|uniref:hypothetical protein n=1 Tax=uncultured Planococcus sp. TaxID=337815 RepID=UPI00261BF696|nr:hypothetical protein [uncultured Planococcus sp.]
MKYIVNKREYKEVDRLPIAGDKVVSNIDFYGGKVSVGDIIEVDYVRAEDDDHYVSFQQNGLWCFSSPTDYQVIEPTNIPITFAQEIALLEDELDRNNEYISKLERRLDAQQETIDSLVKAVEPINSLRRLLNGGANA